MPELVEPHHFATAVRAVRKRCEELGREIPFDAVSEDWDGKLIPKTPYLNRALRMDLWWRGGNIPAARKQIRKLCADNILLWVNLFCKTYDPRKADPWVPFITYEYQDEAILEIQKAIREGYDVAIEKSRDMGASWMNVIVPTHQMQFLEGRTFKLVSRNESYVDDGSSKSLFWKIDALIEHQPRWLLRDSINHRSMYRENDNLTSSITGESTTGEVARGDRCTAILLDEFAAFETKAGYAALASTQAATNCRIFNSTPKGQANAFYDVIHKTGAKVIRMHWSKHPDKARGLYTSKRDEKTGKNVLELLSDWKGEVEVREKGSKLIRKLAFPADYPFILDGKMRSPWYDRECSRAVNPVEIAQELDIDYAGSDYQFFDPIAIERYREQWCRDPETVGELEIEIEQCNAMRLTEAPKGHFYMFEPLNRDGRVDMGRKFVMGVDVAAGTGASNSTIAIYDRQSNEKVAEYANPHVLPDDFGRMVVAIARFFNNAKIVPDRSGPTGEVLVSRIKAQGYTNFYFNRNTKKMGSPQTDEPGVWLNPAKKTEVMEKYRDAIGHCTVINRSSRAMDECLRFIRTQSGNIEHSAATNTNDPNGARANHGDLVIADALAVLELTEGDSRDIPQTNEVPYGTMAWRMHEERQQQLRETSDELGGEWEP